MIIKLIKIKLYLLDLKVISCQPGIVYLERYVAIFHSGAYDLA